MRFAFLVLLLSANALAIKPPSLQTVDQYINLALSQDDGELRGRKGKFFCRFPMIHEAIGSSRGRTQDEAVQRLQLICIKDQCAHLGAKVQASTIELLKMPDQDLRDFLEFNGLSQTEIDATMAARGSVDPAKASSLTCANASANFRTVAFDACFSVPVECGQQD